MIARIRSLVLVALLVVPLSACSAAGAADPAAGAAEPSASGGGAIELAVSETCDGADAQCVLVNGEKIVSPDAFERAGVENAAVAEGSGQNAVGVTFSEAGAAVLHTLTDEAASAGQSARLVMRIGGEVRASVRVMEALTGDQLQIALSPDDNAQDVVDLILKG